jgi:integrase
VAAVESCCRLGELLSLTWADVNLSRKELTVRAENAKTRTARTIPISTRLAGVLEMAKTALETELAEAEGGKVSAEDHRRALARSFVFGDSIGQQVKSLKRTWATAVLKAHGHTPQWSKLGNKLKPESRAALRSIDLHFHDLRHEGGSRLLEAGWPIHHVQQMLGHANLSQTSTYLNATKTGLQDSMRRFEDARCKPVVKDASTDHSLVYNEQPEADSKLSVN